MAFFKIGIMGHISLPGKSPNSLNRLSTPPLVPMIGEFFIYSVRLDYIITHLDLIFAPMIGDSFLIPSFREIQEFTKW